MMGSPETEKDRAPNETQHEVTISQPFYMGKYVVTQEQYEAVTGTQSRSASKAPKNPVEMVSWDDAQEFCKKVSEVPSPAPPKGRGKVDGAVADGSAVGVCVPGGNDDAVLFRGCGCRSGRRGLVRWQFRQNDPSRGPEEAKCLGPVRHARERVGVVRGLVRGVRSRGGDRSDRAGEGRVPRVARRLLGRCTRQLPFGASRSDQP